MAVTSSPPTGDTSRVVRITLPWLVLMLLGIVVLGSLGGLIAYVALAPLFSSPLDATLQLPTNVREVVSAPGTVVADLVDRHRRSVVLIGRAGTGAPEIIGSGFIVTNDGLLVAVMPDTFPAVVGYDWQGKELTLAAEGTDDVFGLTYFRLPNVTTVPLDIRQGDSLVGEELSALSQSEGSFTAKTSPFLVTDYQLPRALPNVGIQRLMHGTLLDRTIPPGSPLIGQDGRVAGVVIAPDIGVALPVGQLQVSIERVTRRQREVQPYKTLGFTAAYVFTEPSADTTSTFAVRVTTITPGGIAARAGLKTGDLITAIAAEPVDWSSSVVHQISVALPLSVTVQRDGAQQELTL